MYQVVKRDGKTVSFDIAKISAAIKKAFDSIEKPYDDNVIDFISLKVTADFASKVNDGKIAVEEIQDSVEKVLGEAGYGDVAKSYILYRRNREKIRNMKSTVLDYKKIVDDYLKLNDWRVKENSTVSYSIGGLILSNSGAITANYWLSEVYDDEIAKAHRNCDIHIHDLSMLSGYCAGWSIKQLIQEGLGGVVGKITSAPAKHLSTLCNQMVNFLGIMQNEWAGAQAFSSFDTYLAPFVKVDNLSYDEVKQCIQSFVYGVNTPSRWGTQAPFTNVTLDWVIPQDLRNVPALVGGKDMSFTYGECQKEDERGRPEKAVQTADQMPEKIGRRAPPVDEYKSGKTEDGKEKEDAGAVRERGNAEKEPKKESCRKDGKNEGEAPGVSESPGEDGKNRLPSPCGIPSPDRRIILYFSTEESTADKPRAREENSGGKAPERGRFRAAGYAGASPEQKKIEEPLIFEPAGGTRENPGREIIRSVPGPFPSGQKTEQDKRLRITLRCEEKRGRAEEQGEDPAGESGRMPGRKEQTKEDESHRQCGKQLRKPFAATAGEAVGGEEKQGGTGRIGRFKKAVGRIREQSGRNAGQIEEFCTATENTDRGR